MRNHRNLVLPALITLFGLWLGQHATAGTNPARTTHLTFSRAVQLPGVALHAGTYVFELANPETSNGVVRVLSADRRTSYYMGFTRAVERPSGVNSDAIVSLGEAATGAAPRITAWWPTGESSGHQFIYPAQ
jgi:hypothetical protein